MELTTAVFCALLFGSTFAALGVDLSTACYDDNFECMVNNGFSFAIIRIWQSTGGGDPVGPHTVYNAWAGNMTHVDVYMFPCYSCGNPAGQVSSALSYLQSFNDQYGTFWFDIEGPGVYWSNDQGANQAFLNAMINQAVSQGAAIGIYTSASQWIPIFGSSYTGGSAYPLWYAHYDNNPSFDDFQPFGGWNSPAIKQYNDQPSLCGCGVDYNYYP